MNSSMQAATIAEPGKVRVGTVPVPAPGPGEVRIEVRASGICGTDIHIYRGDYIGSYPVIPGHEFSGVVVETGAGVSRFSVGDHVAVEPNIACGNCAACLENRQNFCENWRAVGVLEPGSMAQYVLAPEQNVFSIGKLSFEAGAFVEPLSCVLHGVQHCGVRLADRVLIIGAGPIGNLLMQAIRAAGASRIDIVDRNASRLELALQSGGNSGFQSLDELKTDFHDLVVDATGVPALMSRTIDFARRGGRILLFGVPPQNGRFDIPAFPVFQKGIAIYASFTSVRNSIQAVRMLESGAVNVSKLVSRIHPLDRFAESMEMIERGDEGVLKILINPQI